MEKDKPLQDEGDLLQLISPLTINSVSSTLPTTLSSSRCSRDEYLHSTHGTEDKMSLHKLYIHPTGLSDRLHSFAKEIEELEGRISNYQVIIQKQQIELQKYKDSQGPKVISQLRVENKSLRDENQSLLVLVNTQRQPVQVSESATETGPGWLMASHDFARNAPSMMHQPDSPMMKRMESLQTLNTKLVLANQEWHSRWEQLYQSKQEEKEELASCLKDSETKQHQLEAEVATLHKQLQREQLMKKNLEENLVQQKALVDTLKTEMTRQHAEMKLLKAKEQPNQDEQQENQSEMALLKHQLSIFMDDFAKEKQEKSVYKDKLQRRERESAELKFKYEQKLKNWQAQATLKDDKIKQRDKEIVSLQSRVSQLNNELKEEKKRFKPTPQAIVVQSQDPAPSGDTTILVCPSNVEAPMYSSVSAFSGLQSRGPLPSSLNMNVPDTFDDVVVDDI